MAVNELIQYCVKNPCYVAGAKLNKVSFLVVHSPAVIKASGYSSDVIITGNQWYKRWNLSSVEKLAHGVIDTDGVHRFAPDTMACWHVGSAYGNANSLGFEFCEYTDLTKAKQIYQVGVEYYATLCKKYGLKSTDIYGHYEAYAKGWASGHSDPKPYFATIGKTMNDFRSDVDKILNGNVTSTTTDKKTVSGTITVLKNVNVRNSYSFANNTVVGKAYAGEQHQVVESKTVDGTLMYKTATGKYITGASSYVKFQEGVDPRISYSVHVQTYGNLPSVANGCVAGTIGESKRLEAITINCDVPIQYRTHVQTYGWQDWKTNGQVAGTSGESKRLEAIQIKRTDGGNIKYRVHMQGIGWGNWVSNGTTAGTTGQSRRIEAIQIILE